MPAVSTDPKCCHPDDSLSVATERMWRDDLASLPVVDGDGRVLGVITDRDVAIAAFQRRCALTHIRVRDALTHASAGSGRVRAPPS